MYKETCNLLKKKYFVNDKKKKMIDIFGSLAQAKQEVNFLRVRNLQLKINMEQCVRNQLKEFPIHEVDQIITSIENVLKPTDSIENFYAEKLKNSTSRVGGLKMTKVGDKKCLCDCTGQYNEIVEDLSKHGGVDILTLLSTLGFIGSGGTLTWIALAVKFGVKKGFGASTRKRLVNWVQESLHEHNLLDYTKVDAMESAFLWYFLIYKPTAFDTVENEIKQLDDELFYQRKNQLFNQKKYLINGTNGPKGNILQFIKLLQNNIFSPQIQINDRVLGWENLIENKILPDPDIQDKAKNLQNLYLQNVDWKTIQQNFKDALWFGIDANDIVEINGLICLEMLNTFIKHDENEYKKLIQDLASFNYSQDSKTHTFVIGNELYKEFEKINFQYTLANLKNLKLFFNIVTNLPEHAMQGFDYPSFNFDNLTSFLTKRYFGTETNRDALIKDDTLQLSLIHILSLNRLKDQFVKKYEHNDGVKQWIEELYNYQINALKEKYPILMQNIDELKYFIYKQKSEFSTLVRLDEKQLKDILNTTPIIKTAYTNAVYVSSKDPNNELLKAYNIQNIETFTKHKVFIDLLRKEVFKEFDY